MAIASPVATSPSSPFVELMGRWASSHFLKPFSQLSRREIYIGECPSRCDRSRDLSYRKRALMRPVCPSPGRDRWQVNSDPNWRWFRAACCPLDDSEHPDPRLCLRRLPGEAAPRASSRAIVAASAPCTSTILRASNSSLESLAISTLTFSKPGAQGDEPHQAHGDQYGNDDWRNEPALHCAPPLFGFLGDPRSAACFGGFGVRSRSRHLATHSSEFGITLILPPTLRRAFASEWGSNIF
jgi:hypothetical protein